jgi:uncharacterized protein (TIGR00369 family)
MQPLNAEQLAELNARSGNTMPAVLGIIFTAADNDQVVATMPITDNVRQPFGILHGGATVALCETVASIGTYLGIDRDQFIAVGLEINANHLRPVREGTLTATGRPLHRGRTTWVWDIRVQNEAGQLTAISRCTIAVVPQRGNTTH